MKLSLKKINLYNIISIKISELSDETLKSVNNECSDRQLVVVRSICLAKKQLRPLG